MAFTAVAAVVAGGASTAVVFAAVAEVGMAITVVGAITGSKDMMKVGGIMSLAGGIGSMAVGAMDAAGSAAADAAAADSLTVPADYTASVDSSMSGISGDASNLTADSFSTGGAAVDGTAGATVDAGAAGATGDVAGTVSGAADTPAALDNSLTPSVQPAATDSLPPGDLLGSSTPPIDASLDPTSVTNTSGAAPSPGDTGDHLPSGDLLNGNNGAPLQKQAAKGFFGDITDWINKNPTATKLAGQALQGVGQAYEDNKKYQLMQGQLGINQGDAALRQKQAANGNSVPTIQNVPGLPQTPTPYSGIISGARG